MQALPRNGPIASPVPTPPMHRQFPFHFKAVQQRIIVLLAEMHLLVIVLGIRVGARVFPAENCAVRSTSLSFDCVGFSMIGSNTKSWRRLTLTQWRYAFGALWFLAIARLRFGLVPTPRLLKDLSTPPVKPRTKSALDPGMVAWSIAAVARRLPWRSDCLIQAMAATAWLRSAGYAPEFHLGVRSAEEDGIAAHAWLTLDGDNLIGGTAEQLSAFAPIMSPHKLAPVASSVATDEDTRAQVSGGG